MEPKVESNVCLPLPIEEPIELYEKAIAKMRKWLSGIYPPSKVDRALHVEYVDRVEDKVTHNDGEQHVVDPSIVKELQMEAKIWTANNEYSITAYIHPSRTCGYLGCGSLSRKFRTGETWNRGNDLADGGFTEQTWQKILCDIVRYEAEEIRSWRWKGDDFAARHGGVIPSSLADLDPF